mmetsp:Transcript_29861/g.86742  ORF Transcript_29861/g.86742 Transcript_29861/m.86742 type:complete len:223 (+) Transcript_29861:544-1212(+)
MVPRISLTFCRSTPETPRVLMIPWRSSDLDSPMFGSADQNSNQACKLSAVKSGGFPRSSLRRSSRKFSTIHWSSPPSATKASSLMPSSSEPSECHWFHQPSLGDRSPSPSCAGGAAGFRTPLPCGEESVRGRQLSRGSMSSPPSVTPRARRRRSASSGSTASSARTTSSRSRRPLPEMSTSRNHFRGAFSMSGKTRAEQPPGACARQRGHMLPSRWTHDRQK